MGEPDDQYEQEADQVATQLMRMREGDFPIQRKCTQCEEEVMQRKEANGVPNMQADFNNSLQGTKGRGASLSGNTRQFMESRMGADFSNVRIHTGNASEMMNRDISARAFTHGSDIYFNRNEYQPESSSGKELLAHELTHTIQQKGATIRRAIDEERISSTPVNTIFSDDTYFENNITRIQFFDAQLAILHYADGSQIRVGLVPDQLDANVPIQGVDYLTSSNTHLRFNPQRTGQVQFIPRGTEIVPLPGATLGEVERDFSHSITFTHDQGSGRIVPSIVNTLTAPRLCEVLQRARSQYSRQMDEMAAGMVETLEVMEWVVILASLIPSGGTSSTASGTRVAGGAAAATTGVMGRATSRLSRLFSRLLRTGSTEAMAVVEGVEFHTVRVAMSESQLVITRFGIRNASRVSGQGRLIQAAYERAAILAAREAGATSVSIRMQTVVNAGWRTYLESQGFAMQMIENADGFSNLLVKVITL